MYTYTETRVTENLSGHLNYMAHESLEEVVEYIGFGKFQYIFILLCGILQSFDAIEILILAFIQPILKCAWQATLWEESFLITGVFIGMLIGSLIMGRICDLYGRKQILVLSSILLAYIGLLCAASPSIIWFTILRAFIGFSLGGVMSALATLVSELMPIKNRGHALVAILAFFPIGSYIITILCITIVPNLGWRAFLALSTLPLVMSLPFLLWLPESPRFLLLKQRKTEALAILNRIAKMNSLPPIDNVVQPPNYTYSFWDIFHKNYVGTTIIMSVLWCVSGLTYYGIILIVTTIDSIPRQCLQNLNTFHQQLINSTSAVDDSCCIPITWSNSSNTIISTTGELVFIPITLLMVSVVGRKYSMSMFSLFIAMSFVIMNFCMPPLVTSIVLFISRGSISGLFNINFIYTSEVFPTSVRSFALGLCSASARIGAMLSPFIHNFIINRYSFLQGTMIYTFFNLVAFVVALMLPFETKGRPLFQTADEYMALSEKKMTE